MLLPSAAAKDLLPSTARPAGALVRWRATAYALLCVSTFALSACTFADSNTSNGTAPPPGATAAAAPAGPTPMDAFRTLAPPEGMKFTPLFSVPAGSDDARFARIEQAVQTLRNDFDTVTPTLVRLAAIEKDIRDLVGQLRTLTDEGPIVESVPLAPVQSTVVSPAAPAAAATAAPATTTTATTQTTKIPGEGTAGGTEAAEARMATAVPKAPSSPVTPEAASTGQLPPDGAASPSSARTPSAVVLPATAPTPAPAATAPSDALTPEPLSLTPSAPPSAPKPVAPAVQPETKTAASPAATMPAPTPTPAQRPPGDQTQATAPVPVAPAAPAPAPTTPPTAAAPAVAAPDTPPTVTMGPVMGDLRDIRIGDHIDKTRIVLDASAKAPYKARLNAAGTRLYIELPQYAWKAAASWKPSATALLVSGYTYEEGLLTLDLRAPARIVEQASIPAAGGAGERIVIDLFASQVHTQ